MSLNTLRERARKILLATSHPTVQGLSETLEQEPAIMLDKIAFRLFTRYAPPLSYEEIIELPNVYCNATEVEAWIEEIFDHLEDNTPIVVQVEVSADLPSEVRALLLNMGKIKTEIQEARTYQLLSC
jgi:hypothetical protein